MKHIHHIQFKSRGGSDDSFNLCEMDFIEHCELHALDFINGGAWFDFRHEGWAYLNPDLRNRVLEEAKRRGKEKNFLTDEGRRQGGITRGEQCVAQREGVCGQSLEKMQENGRKGGVKGGKTQGKKNAENKTGFCNPEVQSKNANLLNSKRVQCTKTGHISTPGGLSRYQQGKGIDHTNPNNRRTVK